MAECRNEAQVRRALMPMIRNAVEYMMQQIYDYNEKLINEEIYADYTPTVYQRTGQFAKAWKYEPTTKYGISGNSVDYQFTYDPSAMTYNSALGQHGTPDRNLVTGADLSAAKEAWGDVRDYLADILYYGNTGDLFGDSSVWRHEDNVWGMLVRVCDRRQIFVWLKEGLTRQGLEVTMPGW